MARNSIIVGGTGIAFEAKANAAITPGQLVEELSTGKVQKQATAAAVVQKMVAIEDALQGKKISEEYAIDARVFHRVFAPGDEVFMILADGQVVVKGDRVEAAGGGEVRKQATTSAGAIVDPEALVGFAREAIDASDSAATALASRRLVIRIA